MIEEAQDTQLPAIVDDTLVLIAQQVEERLDAMSKIKRVALKLTNPHDWVDQNGRPYLQASGAEKIARMFGISWRISEPILENEDGGHYNYTYKGEFSLGGASIDAIGTRSSKDGFFKKYRYEGPEGNKKKIELPVSEIDRGDVKKAAYTNLLGNGITRILGIRNLTYEDLEEFAGIKETDVFHVEYQKGGKPSSPQAGKSGVSNPNAPNNQLLTTEAQGKAIHTMLSKLQISDELAKHQKVATILGLTEIPTSVGKLTKAEAFTVIQALDAELEGPSG